RYRRRSVNLPNRITVGRLLLALIFFAFFRFASLADAPEWWKPAVAGGMVVLIIAREFMVSGLRGFIEARGVAFPSRWDGKLKMILQCVAIPAVFLHRMVELGWPTEKWIADPAYWF